MWCGFAVNFTRRGVAVGSDLHESALDGSRQRSPHALFTENEARFFLHRVTTIGLSLY